MRISTFEIVLNRKILFILLISINTTFIQSQYNFEMGFSIGASNHFGEIGGKSTEAKGFISDLLLNQSSLSGGWFARYK